MTKFMLVITILLSISIFLHVFAHMSRIQEFNSLSIIPVLTNDDKTEILTASISFMNIEDMMAIEHVVIQIAEEHSADIVIGSSRKRGPKIRDRVYYFFSIDMNNPINLQFPWLLGDKHIDFSAPTQQFYTSNIRTPDAYNYFDFFDRRNNNEYLSKLYIYQFSDFFHNGIERGLNVHLFMRSANVQELENSMISRLYGLGHITLGTFMDSQILMYERSYDFIFLIIVFLLLFLVLTIVDLVHRASETSIRKLCGHSVVKIYKRIFFRGIAVRVLVYGSIQLVLGLKMAGIYRASTEELYNQLLLYFIFFIAFHVVLSIIVLLMVRNLNYVWLKRKATFSKLFEMSILVKAITGMFLLVPFVVLGVNTIQSIEMRLQIAGIESSAYEYYSIFAIDHSNHDFSEMAEIDYRVYNVLDEFPIEFIDIDRQRAHEGWGDAFELRYPLAVMNRRSFSQINLYGIEGGRIQIDELSYYKDYLFIPSDYNVEKLYLYKVASARDTPISVIYVRDTPDVHSLCPMSCPRYVERPVIAMFSSFPRGYQQAMISIQYPSVRMRLTNEERQELYKALEEAELSVGKTVWFFNLTELRVLRSMQLNNEIRNFLIILIGYLVAILALVYFKLFLFIRVKRKQLVVEYLHGFSTLKKYSGLVLCNYSANLFGLIVIILTRNNYLLETVVVFMVLNTLEAAYIRSYIRKSERKYFLYNLRG